MKSKASQYQKRRAAGERSGQASVGEEGGRRRWMKGEKGGEERDELDNKIKSITSHQTIK